MKVLHLTLKKKWFDMIASGEKTEEYRDIKPYWENRLFEFDIVSRNSYSSFKKPVGFKDFKHVNFTNGYRPESRIMRRPCLGISISEGKPEWGAEPGKKYFVIKLGA